MTTKPQSTTESWDRPPEPCWSCGGEAEARDDIHVRCIDSKGINCEVMGHWFTRKTWNTRSPASTAPVVDANEVVKEIRDKLINGNPATLIEDIAKLVEPKQEGESKCEHGVPWSMECLSCGPSDYAAATAAPQQPRSNHFPNEALNKGFPDHISRDGTAYYSDGAVLPSAAPVEQSDEVTLRIPTCGKCPFVDHSGAFTPGGAQPICGHRDAPDTFAAGIAGDERFHWKYRQVALACAPPEKCPLRQPVTDDNEGAR